MQSFFKNSSCLLILFVIISGCLNNEINEKKIIDKDDSTVVSIVVKGDTTIKKHVVFENTKEHLYNDTIVYFRKSLENRLSNQSFFIPVDRFKIYFDKRQVIEYCDSIIKNTSFDKQHRGADGAFVNQIEDLKGGIELDKKKDTYSIDLTAILMARFTPLRITDSNSKEADFMLIENFSSNYFGYKRYSILTPNGDTTVVFYWAQYYNLTEVGIKNGM